MFSPIIIHLIQLKHLIKLYNLHTYNEYKLYSLKEHHEYNIIENSIPKLTDGTVARSHHVARLKICSTISHKAQK